MEQTRRPFVYFHPFLDANMGSTKFDYVNA